MTSWYLTKTYQITTVSDKSYASFAWWYSPVMNNHSYRKSVTYFSWVDICRFCDTIEVFHVYIFVWAHLHTCVNEFKQNILNQSQTCVYENLVIKYVMSMHYNDVIMGAVASQITSLTIVYSTVDSDPDQRKHQSSASLTFVWGIHRGPVNTLHKWPVTRKMFHLMTSSWSHVMNTSCWPWHTLEHITMLQEWKSIEFHWPNILFKILRQRRNGRNFWKLKIVVFLTNFTEICLICPINNDASLVQTMAWRLAGDTSLSEPMTDEFTDAYMRHLASMSSLVLYDTKQKQWFISTELLGGKSAWEVESPHGGSAMEKQFKWGLIIMAFLSRHTICVWPCTLIVTLFGVLSAGYRRPGKTWSLTHCLTMHALNIRELSSQHSHNRR